MSHFNVVIRTKDRPNLLSNALKSLTRQTFTDFEVTVVNDGGQPIDEVLAKYRKLKINHIYHPTSLGKGTAANVAAQQGNAPYLTLLDDDDLYLPHHLQTLYEHLKDNPTIQLCYTDTRVKHPNGQTTIHTWDYDLGQIAVMRGSPIACSVCIAKTAWDDVNGFDPQLVDAMDDWDLYLRLAQQHRFTRIPQVTTVYHMPSVHKAYEKHDKMLSAIAHIHRADKDYLISSQTLKQVAQQLVHLEAVVEYQRRLLHKR